MSIEKTTTPHRPLDHIKFEHWCGFSIYRGSKEGLIDAGVAREEWFSRVGEFELAGKRQVRTWRFELGNGEHARLTWEPGCRFAFRLYVDADDEERLRREGRPDRLKGMGQFLERGRIELAPIRAARADAAFGRFIGRALEPVKLTGKPKEPPA